MILVQLHVRVNAALAGFIRMQRSAADDFGHSQRRLYRCRDFSLLIEKRSGCSLAFFLRSNLRRDFIGESGHFKDIAERTGGYLSSVVGAVRTGKSTFIKRFMETIVLPNIASEADRARAVDELPQSAAAKLS